MNVENAFGMRSHRFYESRPEGNIRNELPVHDVEMQPVRARSIHALGFTSGSTEIRRQERRRNNHDSENKDSTQRMKDGNWRSILTPVCGSAFRRLPTVHRV